MRVGDGAPQAVTGSGAGWMGAGLGLALANAGGSFQPDGPWRLGATAATGGPATIMSVINQSISHSMNESVSQSLIHSIIFI